MKRATAAIIALGFALTATGCAAPDEEEAPDDGLSGYVLTYADSSLQGVLAELEPLFNEAHPEVELEFIYNGSSALTADIQTGSPADVFISADAATMAAVTDEGLADGNPLTLAINEPAIAVEPGNPLGISSLADLTAAEAVGVCDVAEPCGSAAQTLLERDDVDLETVIAGANVTSVLDILRDGDVDAAIVYSSDIVRSQGDVEGVEIADAADAASEYLAVPLLSSANSQAAWAWAQFIASDAAQEVFVELGFAVSD